MAFIASSMALSTTSQTRCKPDADAATLHAGTFAAGLEPFENGNVFA
jgi:hypothetical protein